MGEPTLALVELIVICLLICLVYAKKKKPNPQLFDSASVDYAVTTVSYTHLTLPTIYSV